MCVDYVVVIVYVSIYDWSVCVCVYICEWRRVVVYMCVLGVSEYVCNCVCACMGCDMWSVGNLGCL